MLGTRSLCSSLLFAGLLVPAFSGCTSNVDGLFTNVGGASDEAGASGVLASGGSSSTIGGHTSIGGGTASSGGTASAGATSIGGEPNGTPIGGTSNAGTNSGGANTQGGTSTGGANAGSSSGGTTSGGTSSAGSDSGGTSNAGTSSGGASTAGSNSGGSSNAGTGGGAPSPTCADLLARAADELTAAQACDNSRKVAQCAGRVETTCGCTVPVDEQSSNETQAYLATLKQLDALHCTHVCSALACLPFTRAQCSSKGGSGSSCVAIRGPIAQ